MLTQDRPELAKRAVECFRKQTYPVKALYLQDFGVQRFDPGNVRDLRMCLAWDAPNGTIGSNRNAANKGASGYQFRNQTSAPWLSPDIFIHWDDDDWSHPNRIAEQVALLQSSGADVVGYNEMLFWRTRGVEVGEAWLYSGPTTRQALGTSLCYWRKTWEARPFNPQLPRVGPGQKGGGEDWEFLRDRKIEAVSSLAWSGRYERIEMPRMIARIHGGNSSNGYSNLEESPNWKRVPQWDDKVREMLG